MELKFCFKEGRKAGRQEGKKAGRQAGRKDIFSPFDLIFYYIFCSFFLLPELSTWVI